MKEKCKDVLLQLLGILMGSVIDDGLKKEVGQIWYPLSSAEQDEVLKLAYSVFEGEPLPCTYFFSILLQILKDRRVKYYIEESLLQGNLSLADAGVILWSYRHFLFNHKDLSDGITEEERAADFQRHRSVYRRQVSMAKELAGEREYIPYDQRNKGRILLMIEPLMIEQHAPTKVMLSMYYYFVRLGYETLFVATSYKELCLSCTEGWYDVPVMNSNLEQTGMVCAQYRGMQIKGYHIMYDQESFMEQIKSGVDFVREFNPLFVLSIGEANLLADVCNDITTVVTRGTTIEPPCTTVSYLLDTNSGKGRAAEFYDRCLQEGQKLFRIPFRFEEKTGEETLHTVTRGEYHIPEDCFLIMICGNRLEQEITEPVCEVLEAVTALSKEIVIAFVGECPELKKKMGSKQYAGQLRFMGVVNRFEEVIGLADLCLNPPRSGGGTSAYYCLNQEIPVVTLPDGDVADAVGEHFYVNALEDMPAAVRRYMTDRAYMEEQKMHCREAAEQRGKISNLDNVRLLCDLVIQEITGSS